jgi:hypothetical protein
MSEAADFPDRLQCPELNRKRPDCGEERFPYAPPCVVRVRVETTRLASGKQDAQSHCTWHYHDTPANCPNA